MKRAVGPLVDREALTSPGNANPLPDSLASKFALRNDYLDASSMARYRAAARSSVAGLADDLQADAAGGAPKGLSYVPYLPGDLETAWSAPAFATAEMVDAAAAMFARDGRRRTEGPARYRVIVGGGSVQLAASGVQDRVPAVGHTRGEIVAWTQRSRVRMTKRLSDLDYQPMAAQGTLAVVTLTIPGEWLVVAPNGRAFKRLWEDWLKLFERAWGYPPALTWKLEFQRRGAPHMHMLLAVPDGRDKTRGTVGAAAPVKSHSHKEILSSGNGCPTGERADYVSGSGDRAARRSRAPTARCRCRVCGPDGDQLAFREWLSHSWAAVVDHPDPEQYRRHVLAGTGLDFAAAARMTDPHRVAAYFAKHGGAAGGKEYQHEVPVEWRGEGMGPGRFWGVRGLTPALAGVDVERALFYRYRRVMRKWSVRVSYYPPGAKYPTLVEKRTRSSRVPRGSPVAVVDHETGELTWRQRRRKVVRPYSYMTGQLGGFVMPNNGPSFAARLSRLE
jgi:hypothetical protein